MIKLRVDDETAIPLSVDSSSAVSMTVSEAFIDRGGSAIQNNKNATPSTSQVVVTPDPGYDGMAKVTVAAMPQGALSPIDIDFNDNTGAFTAEARVGTSGYISDDAFVGGGFQLATQEAATITPSTVQQQAVAAHKYTKGAVVVDPIPPEYIIPSGTKSIAANGTGIDVKAYEKVDVAVPGITPSGTLAIATNGSHDVTNYATASVAVPASAVDSGTKAITANGNGQDVVGYAAVNVNVPNSYSASDEGKVVQSGALVAQTSDTVTTNDTYDTTLINSLTVNVSGGGGTYEVDEVKEYTQAVDWSSDSLGNTLNFVNTYMDAQENDTRFRVAYVYNNTWTGSYKASTFWIWRSGASANSGSGAFTNAYPNRSIGSNNSWRIAAGSKIRVVYLKSVKRDSSEAAPS